MSKQNKSKKTRGPKGNGKRTMPGEIVYSGKELLTFTVAASTTVATTLQSFLVSSTSQVLGTLGTTFAMYRFEKLNLRIFPIAAVAGTAGVVAYGYSNEVTDTPPSNLSIIASLPCSQLQTADLTTCISLRIPKKYLLGENALKFWRTQISTAGTPSSTLWDDVQGTIFVRSTFVASITATMLMSYSVRLVDAQPPSSIPRPLPVRPGDMASIPRHPGTRLPCTAPGIMCVLQLHGLPCEFHDETHLV